MPNERGCGNDFYFGADDFEFPLGSIQKIGKSQWEMFRSEKPTRIGAVNPALTAMANSLRVGDHLLERLA